MNSRQNTYTVNLHHRGGFIWSHLLTASNKAAAEQQVRDAYPAVIISRVVVMTGRVGNPTKTLPVAA